MAATSRTSTVMVRWPPTRSNWRSWMARSSFTWAASGSSPTSSRNSVPPSAASKRPCCAWWAPVKAPRSWPKSADSTSASGSAAQFTATKGRPARGLSSWSARATTSLPVPLSPRSSTVARLGATWAITCSTACQAGLRPMTPGKRSGSEPGPTYRTGSSRARCEGLSSTSSRMRTARRPATTESTVRSRSKEKGAAARRRSAVSTPSVALPSRSGSA